MKTFNLILFLAGVILAGSSCADLQPTATAPPFVFNGTNLDGWVKMNAGTFVVTNGILHLEGGKGWLRTERQFTNFVMEAEWRGLETNYNSGIFIRAPIEGNPWATNVWQLNTKQSSIGELLCGSSKTVRTTAPSVAVGEWVKFQIWARGTNLVLNVDGKFLWEFRALTPASGYIGLQAEGKAIDFRNLQIHEITGFAPTEQK